MDPSKDQSGRKPPEFTSDIESFVGIRHPLHGTMSDMTSLPNRPEVRPVTMSFQQWLQHGEMLYQAAMQEHHALEAQLDELERRLAAKQTELNQIAAMMSKPPVEGARRVSAQIMTPPPMPEEADRTSNGANSTSATIARALTGMVVRQPG